MSDHDRERWARLDAEQVLRSHEADRILAQARYRRDGRAVGKVPAARNDLLHKAIKVGFCGRGR